MKQTRSFINSLVACGIAFAMVSTLCAQTKDGMATVLRINGSARYSVGNNVWQPLKAGDHVRAGTTIQTDRENGSFVDLAIGEGAVPVIANAPGVGVSYAPSKGGTVRYQPAAQQNTVRVFENTVLGIDKMTSTETGAENVTDTQLDLKAGRIVGNVKKMSAASRYEVKLPNGVAGIRGTVYDITADGIIRVASGSVVVSFVDAQGNVQTRVISGSQEYNPRTDQITPMGAGSMETIMNIGTGLQLLAVAQSIPIARDLTIEAVSPTTGSTFEGNIGGGG